MNLNPRKNISFKCDRCGRQDEKKYNPLRKEYSKINEVSYWTDSRGWEDFKLICRECLKGWYENNRESFLKLVSAKKRITFTSYLNKGLLGEKRLSRENNLNKYKK